MSCAALFCSVLLISCGLETFYKIEPPDNADLKNPADGTTLSVTTTAETRKYEFSSKSNGGFIAAGTEVYYRIYNSVEKLQQDARSINAVNTDIGGNGFAGMERLGYKKLRVHSGGENQDLLIKNVHRVVIRLADDGILVGGVFYDGAGSPQFSPVLRDGDRQFYFKTDSPTLNPPETGNADVDSEDTGALAGKYWYVNAYAVSVGLVSATWTRSVSKLLPLGFLAFEKNRS